MQSQWFEELTASRKGKDEFFARAHELRFTTKPLANFQASNTSLRIRNTGSVSSFKDTTIQKLSQ
jgi:hypothetical protein